MYTLKFLAPILFSACVEGILNSGNGYICNIDQSKPNVVKYYEPEKSCYVEGVFYPRCKDYDNPEVKHYHNLLRNR